jgi:hypothetical protein
MRGSSTSSRTRAGPSSLALRSRMARHRWVRAGWTSSWQRATAVRSTQLRFTFTRPSTSNTSKTTLARVRVHAAGLWACDADEHAVAAKYQKPIWITEFQGQQPGDEVAFINQLVPWLDSEPSVERYAYFAGKQDSLVVHLPSELIIRSSDRGPTHPGWQPHPGRASLQECCVKARSRTRTPCYVVQQAQS